MHTLRVVPIGRHGMEQFAAVIRDPANDKAVVSVIRWSKEMARADAQKWASSRGIELVDSNSN